MLRRMTSAVGHKIKGKERNASGSLAVKCPQLTAVPGDNSYDCSIIRVRKGCQTFVVRELPVWDSGSRFCQFSDFGDPLSLENSRSPIHRSPGEGLERGMRGR